MPHAGARTASHLNGVTDVPLAGARQEAAARGPQTVSTRQKRAYSRQRQQAPAAAIAGLGPNQRSSGGGGGRFTGARDGYVYKQGANGLGYYIDRPAPAAQDEGFKIHAASTVRRPPPPLLPLTASPAESACTANRALSCPSPHRTLAP